MVKSVEGQSAGEEEMKNGKPETPQEVGRRLRPRRRTAQLLARSAAVKKAIMSTAAQSKVRKQKIASEGAEAMSADPEEVVEGKSKASESEEVEPLDVQMKVEEAQSEGAPFAVSEGEKISLWRWLSRAALSAVAFFSVPPM